MFKFKKYIYFLNDLTNLILSKARVEERQAIKKLRLALIIVSILLAASLLLNLMLIAGN